MRIKGMWTDGSPKNNPAGEEGLTTRQNKNLLITDEFGSISNDKSFELFSNSFNVLGHQPIGKIIIDNNKVIIFSINPNPVEHDNTVSEIGIIDNNGNYKKIISDSLDNQFLNFNSHYPIHGEYTVNVKNEIIITWTDNYNIPKTLNIDDPNINDLELFNISENPIILNSKINEGGGDLLTGTYFPIFRLLKKDNSVTKWYYDYTPIYITDDSITVGKDQYDGEESGKSSKKSITLDVLVTNNLYSKLEVGFIYVKEGIKYAYTYKKYNIDEQSIISSHTSIINNAVYQGISILVNITNNINVEDVDLSEVIIENSIYNKVKLITSDRNQLLMGGLQSYEEPENIQQIVNNVQLTWYSKLIDLSDNQVSDKFNTYNNHLKGFAHGEVYAFYLRFQWKWGWGKWYVCNGRLLEPSDYGLGKHFQVADTIELINDDNNGNIEGHFGAWENLDEEYPLNGGFPTGKVRHFKFPSLQWFRENIYDQDYGIKFFDKLGIKINNLDLENIVDCDGNFPTSVELGYAKRQGYNNLVQGQTPVLIRKGFNFRYETSPGVYLWDGLDVRLYPFELLFSKSSIVANAFKAEYEMYSDQTTEQIPDVDTGIGTGRRFIILDYTKGAARTEDINTLFWRKVDFKFIPGNTNDKINNNNNLYLEEYLKMVSEEMVFNDFFTFPLPENPVPIDPNKSEQTIFITLLNVKDNLYENFNNQDIISTGIVLNNNNLNTFIYGGDIFISDYTFHTARNRHLEFTLDPEDGSKNNIRNGLIAVRRLFVESQYNINFRYVNPDKTNGYTEYYPKSGTDYVVYFERDKRINAFDQGYNTDYNQLLEIYNETYDGIKSNTSDIDQFKIIMSQPFSKETNTNNWRYFRQNDYFIIEKNKGALTNLVFARDWLFIHTEKCLFRTRSRNNYQINSSGEEVYIGTGNIFDTEPFQVIHSELGELGTQHKFSCLITKHGYIFCDAEKGKWFLVNDKIIELSEKGLYNFFIKNLECIGDNPYLGNSIQSVWDDRFRRFIVSLNYQKISQNYQNNFKGVWSNDPKFLNSLNIGDVVYYKGKYMRYNP